MILAAGFFFYSLISNELSRYNENKKIRNILLSFIHIILCIMIYSVGWFLNNDNIFKSLICANTGGFFINDIKLFIKDRRFSNTNLVLIIHHIMSASIIFNAEFRSNVYFILVGLEFTNMPGCIMYYFIQIKKEHSLKGDNYIIPYEKFIKYTQALIYIIIRVFLSPVYVYRSLNYDNNINTYNKILYAPIYLIGVIWSIKLFNNLNRKKIKNN